MNFVINCLQRDKVILTICSMSSFKKSISQITLHDWDCKVKRFHILFVFFNIFWSVLILSKITDKFKHVDKNNSTEKANCRKNTFYIVSLCPNTMTLSIEITQFTTFLSTCDVLSELYRNATFCSHSCGPIMINFHL